MDQFEVIVVGGGTMGSAAAWALGKRGVRALVIEQFAHVHDRGSHSGKIRIIRHAYAESPDYVPLAQEADRQWQALEAATGQSILVRTGGLDLAAPGYTQARAARASAEQFGLSFEWLGGQEIRRRWPAWTVDDSWEACFSPDAGYLLVEPALRSLIQLASRAGVTLRTNEPVRGWQVGRSGVVVETVAGRYHAERLILTAGAWTSRLLQSVGLPLTVLRKVVWWLAIEEPAWYVADAFPIFIAESALGSIYGFPLSVGDGLRIANHSGGSPTTPETVDRTIQPSELDEVLPFAQRYLRGVSRQVRDSAVCLYTMTPDHHFIVDRHPAEPRIVVGAGFSGHGFKFAPVIGEMLASLALDEQTTPLPLFAFARFLGR